MGERAGAKRQVDRTARSRAGMGWDGMGWACKETDPGQRIGSVRWYEGLKSEVVVIEEKQILEFGRVVLALVVHGMSFG